MTPSSSRLTEPDRAEVASRVELYVLEGDPHDRPVQRALTDVRDELVRTADGTWRIAAHRITVLAGSR